MSYSTLYAFGDKGTICDAVEFRNSWGSAARVWTAMSERYLGQEGFGFGDDEMRPLWGLYKRLDIPLQHRAVLVSTFDRAIVLRADFVRMAEAFEAFDADLPAKPGTVNHLPAFAESLRSWSDGNVMAAAWRQTSVSDNLWWIDGEGDEDEGRSYNVLTDTNHEGVFQVLASPGDTE